MALPTKKSVVEIDFKKMRTVIVGEPKVGKTTLASELGEDVVIGDTEAGTKFKEGLYVQPLKNWDDVELFAKDLLTTKHDFKNVCFDVWDKVVEFAQAEICKRNALPGKDGVLVIPHINDVGGGFGKGADAARKLYRPLIESLYASGLGVIFILHPREKEVEVDGIKVDQLRMNLADKDEAFLNGWADLILYAHTNKQDQRLIRTKGNTYVKCAGDRSGKLPMLMPLDAKQVMEALVGPKPTPPTTPTNKLAAVTGNISPIKNHAPQTQAEAMKRVQ